MCSCGNSQVAGKNPQTDLIKDLEHAFSTLTSATKQYTAAAKSVDESLERVAVAFRELSQGSVPPSLQGQVNDFGCAVKKRCAPASQNKKASKDKNGNTAQFFANDLSKRSNMLIEVLKHPIETLLKKADERDAATSKYNAAQAKVDIITKKDLKVNKDSNENSEYRVAAVERDNLRNVMERKLHEYEKAYETLLNKRASAVETALHGLCSDSFDFWTDLANTLQEAVQKPNGLATA